MVSRKYHQERESEKKKPHNLSPAAKAPARNLPRSSKVYLIFSICQAILDGLVAKSLMFAFGHEKKLSGSRTMGLAAFTIAVRSIVPSRVPVSFDVRRKSPKF